MNAKFTVRFTDKVLGESGIIALQRVVETDVNFEAILWYIPSNMKSLDDIAANPVLCESSINIKGILYHFIFSIHSRNMLVRIEK